MHLRALHHLAIQVCDLPRMATFYKEVLRFPERTSHHNPDGSLRSVWLDLPGGGFLALEAAAGQPPKDDFRTPRVGIHLLAFEIAREDRQAVMDELSRHGVPVVHQSRWTLYIRDPEGNRIGLSHHPADPLPPG